MAARYVLLSLLFTALLFSCNTSKVHKSKTDESVNQTTDSNSVKKETTTTTVNNDSANKKKEIEGTETEVYVEFGKDNDSTTTTIVINGDSVKTTGKKPVKMTYKGKKQSEKTDSSAVHTTINTNTDKSDSSSKKTIVAAKKHSSEKDKKTAKVPWLLIVCSSIAGLAIILLLIYKRKK